MKQFYWLCFMLLPLSCFSQIDSYDISTFARQDLIRKTYGLFSDLSLFNRSNSGDGGLTTFSFNGELDIAKTVFENSLEKQRSSTFEAGTFGRINKIRQNINGKTSSLSLSPRVGHQINQKTFHKPNRFWEFENNLDADASFAYDRFVDQDPESTVGFMVNNSVKIGIGKGRTELVLDAWHATTIFRQLKDASLLLKEPTHEDITAFANLIANRKNARFPDPRHGIISEFEFLIKYLIDNEYINPNEYRTFAVFHDAYTFERFIPRFHGKTLSGGIAPGLVIRHESDDPFISELDLRPEIGVYLDYFNYKALTQKVQQNFSANFYTRSFWDLKIREDDTFTTDGTFLGLNIGMDYDVFQSVRTNYGFGADLINTYDSRNESLSTQFRVNGEYLLYVSPQFTWSLTGNIIFNVNSSPNFTDNWFNQNNIRLRTTYWIY